MKKDTAPIDSSDALPTEPVYLHFGLYLASMVENGFYAEYFEKDPVTQNFRFRGKKISTALLAEIWNGYVAYDYLTTRGNQFTYFYYSSGLYRHDYEEIVGQSFPSVYEVDETSPNYDMLKNRINKRYAEWNKLKAMLPQVAPEAGTR